MPTTKAHAREQMFLENLENLSTDFHSTHMKFAHVGGLPKTICQRFVENEFSDPSRTRFLQLLSGLTK